MHSGCQSVIALPSSRSLCKFGSPGLNHPRFKLARLLSGVSNSVTGLRQVTICPIGMPLSKAACEKGSQEQHGSQETTQQNKNSLDTGVSVFVPSKVKEDHGSGGFCKSHFRMLLEIYSTLVLQLKRFLDFKKSSNATRFWKEVVPFWINIRLAFIMAPELNRSELSRICSPRRPPLAALFTATCGGKRDTKAAKLRHGSRLR